MVDDVMSNAESYRSEEEAERALADQAKADEPSKTQTKIAEPDAKLAGAGEAAKSNYRLYCLDAEGQIGFADWIEAASDEEAIGKARKHRPDANKCEVWLENRLVAQIRYDGHLQPAPR